MKTDSSLSARPDGNGGGKIPFRAQIPKYTIRLLALLGITLLVWKIIAVSVTERAYESAMQQLRDSTEQRIDERTTALVRAAGEAGALALHAALRGGDQAQVRRIAELLQRRCGSSEYVVADPAGKVLAASSRGLEGGNLDANLLRVASTLDAPVVDRMENGLTRVIVPVRDESARAGTLILSFRFR